MATAASFLVGAAAGLAGVLVVPLLAAAAAIGLVIGADVLNTRAATETPVRPVYLFRSAALGIVVSFAAVIFLRVFDLG